MSDLSSSDSRINQGKRAGLIGIVCNILLATGKLIAGIMSASTSIISDALNNFSDGISAIITMIGFKLAQKPADAEHPYGHARFEYIASFVISFLILFVGFELAKSSIEKIINPQETFFNILVAIILLVSIIVKLALCIYNFRASKKLKSDVLKAIAIDCRNDVIITSVVLASAVIEYFFSLKIDGYTGLLVSLFIMYSGIKLVCETISPLLGKTDNEDLKQKILSRVKEYPIVIGYHDLMIHDYGPNKSFVSIHFEIDKNHDPLYVHELIDKFEREFLQEGIIVTVHYDPVVTDSQELNELKHLVIMALVEYDVRLSLHDFRCIPCDGFKKVFMDVPLPDDMMEKKQYIREIVEQSINAKADCRYCAEITFDTYSFNDMHD